LLEVISLVHMYDQILYICVVFLRSVSKYNRWVDHIHRFGYPFSCGQRYTSVGLE
jgi:hypothetical protein